MMLGLFKSRQSTDHDDRTPIRLRHCKATRIVYSSGTRMFIAEARSESNDYLVMSISASTERELVSTWNAAAAAVNGVADRL